MNAYTRLHGLLVEHLGLDSTSSAGFPAGGAETNMSHFTPRRGRRPTSRRLARWSTSDSLGVDRLKEGCRMNPQLTEPEVRQELVSRIRQEIDDGVYDTPEKFQAALDRLADRLEDD